MADYSGHAIPAAEWTALLNSRAQDQDHAADVQDLQMAREVENRRREKLARDTLTRPDNVHIYDIDIPTEDGAAIACRLYRPVRKSGTGGSSLLPLYIHFHGGGWFFGTLETEEPYCMTLCNALAQGSQSSLMVAVLNVNYRHTPEHRFPSQILDAWTVFNSAREGQLCKQHGIDSDQIILGGTSAGAALAIATALQEMRRTQKVRLSLHQEEPPRKPSIRGLILSSSPTVHPDLFPYSRLRSKKNASHQQFQDTGVLPTAVARRFYGMYLPNLDYETKCHEWVSPLLIPDEAFSGTSWPPTSIHIAGADAFRDEGFLFADKLTKLGFDVKQRIHSGYGHAFERFPHLEESAKWRRQVIEDIRRFLD